MVDVVCAGAHVLDVLGGPVHETPAPGVRSLVEEMRITVAGTAGGVAVDLARHDVAVATVGVVGDDVAGRLLTMLMADVGVGVSGLRVDPAVQTSMSMHAIGADGERRPMHVVGANRSMGPDDVVGIVHAHAKYVHLGGLDVMPALWSTADARLNSWQQAGSVTTVDVLSGAADDRVPWPAVLSHADWFLPNDLQLRNISGHTSPTDGARWALDHGAGNVVVTLGGDGAVFATRDRLVHLPARDVPVRDTTGCGDALVAGLIVALLAGRDSVSALELGIVAGASTARGFGSDAGIAGLAALEEGLETLPIRIPTVRWG